MWSKLKKTVEALFAPEVYGRVELRSTNYRHAHDQQGRGYITVDGKEVWDMATFAFWNTERPRIDKMVAETGLHPADAQSLIGEQLKAEGHYSHGGYRRALEAYLNASIDENLESTDTLRRALAMLDRRVGRRRLASMDVSAEHPMVRFFHDLRTGARAPGGTRLT